MKSISARDGHCNKALEQLLQRMLVIPCAVMQYGSADGRGGAETSTPSSPFDCSESQLVTARQEE